MLISSGWFGWSRTIWLRLIFFTLLLLVIPPTLGRALGFNVNNVLIWVTGLILLIYTIETQEMRRQMVLQNEIAIQPLVIASIELRSVEDGPGGKRKLVLRNIGRGPALFIQVKDIEVADAGGVRFVRKLATVDCIEAGKDSVAEVSLVAEAEGEEDTELIGGIASLDPRHAEKSYDVTISYEDAYGQKRESVVRMGKGGIRLLRHGKV